MLDHVHLTLNSKRYRVTFIEHGAIRVHVEHMQKGKFEPHWREVWNAARNKGQRTAFIIQAAEDKLRGVRQ